MTLTHEDAALTWREPEAGPALRGTLIVLPVRGESPTVYERFGRRLSVDSYRVHAVTAPSEDPERVAGLVTALLDDADPALPRVLVGSDVGALYAAQWVARTRVDGVSGLILAGLPTVAVAGAAIGWDEELQVRTACPTHQARISTGVVQPGQLSQAIAQELFEAARPQRIAVPVLGLHGGDDAISPLADARSWYEHVPRSELVSVTGGRHDALNDATHRSVAATVVLFLERLKLGADLAPIVVAETLTRGTRS
jgi:alpha-beta hydrolase superfamily lysophospholipase